MMSSSSAPFPIQNRDRPEPDDPFFLPPFPIPRPMIQITQAAAQEVLRLKSKQNDPNDLLFRLAVKSGGCCDWVYQLGFESNPEPTDVVCRCGSLDVVTDRESLPHLEGLTLDYSEDLMGGGFRFDNPNAARTCGCGHSFVARS